MKKPELLIPASSLEVLKTAVLFWCRCRLYWREAFGLRAKAKNFTPEEMREGIAFAHQHGVKVHVTANILAHNADLSGAEQYFHELAELKPDALIIADPGMFTLAREICPEIDIHISTQANNTNYQTFYFGTGWERKEWSVQGAFFRGNKTDPGEDSGRYGDRKFYPWGNVHFLFWQMSS